MFSLDRCISPALLALTSLAFTQKTAAVISRGRFLAHGSRKKNCSFLPATITSAFTSVSFLLNCRKMHASDNTCFSEGSNGLTVAQFPCLSDNYGYLIHDEASGRTAAVDTPDGNAYRAELEKRGWKLTEIFNTHHHWDHTGGNLELKKDGVSVYGPASEKIPGITNPLKGGDEIKFGNSKVVIMEVGGHTLGHIAYYFPNDSLVFVGDSLFALGCGRMFEGTPTQFWTSLKSLRALPDETTVYCAHEYTAANAKFAASVEPGNAELMSRVLEIVEARKRGQPTVPSLLGIEKKTNPFLRCDISEEIRRNVGVIPGESDESAFAKVRKAKDNFRG